jgi:hypothetical protein
MVQVYGTIVTLPPLMDIHADPKLVRCMFNLAQFCSLFVNAVFTVRYVASLSQLKLATFSFPDVCELFAAPINKKLAMKSIK